MGFAGQRVFTPVFLTLMLFPQLKNLGGASSALSSSAIVVAFDVELLSSALDSFSLKGGTKDSFDLVICVPYMKVSDKKLENVLLSKVLDYRSVIDDCSHIAPPESTDYNQLLYLMMPDNKTVIQDILEKISELYETVKKTFYSTRVPKLLWMPLFLVIWPDLQDYCQNEPTSEKLIRASVRSTENFLKTFIVDSDVYFYFGIECNNQLADNIWEVYALSATSDIIVQKLTPDKRKYEAMYEGILGRVRRRMNLHQSAIRAIASKDPSSFLEAPTTGIFDPLEIVNGTPHIVFRELQQTMNFTEVNIVGDWISRNSNGTLKGTTVNLFRHGMADMTISLSSLLPYRKVELSFLQPTYANSVNGFFVQPAASTLRDIVIAPFSFGLWITLLLTYLILVLSILFFGWQYKRMYRHTYEITPEGDETLKNELLLWAVGAATQKGWHICPESNATRIAFMLGYFLGLICYGAFSAAVVSILAVELVPIKSRSDLLTSNLHFYADNASSTMAYIVEYLQKNTTAKFGSRVNIKEGVARLKSKHPSCYIAFPHYFYLSAANINISESWVCSHLSVIPVTTSVTPSSMVVSRNSPHAELFNFMIIKMISRGLNYRYVRMYEAATTWKCVKEPNSFFSPLDIKDVLTSYFILFGGLVLAVVMLFLEGCRKCLSSAFNRIKF